MKTKFSNKLLLDSLSENYSSIQNVKMKKLLYITAGAVTGGIIIAIIYNYFQKIQNQRVVALIKKQVILNNRLRDENTLLRETRKDKALFHDLEIINDNSGDQTNESPSKEVNNSLASDIQNNIPE